MISRPLSISKQKARKIILHAQGLAGKNIFGNRVSSVSSAIKHLGYVQIDTISVVARAHHHVLFSRIPSYKPQWLDSAQHPPRKIFEYWAHAAAYLPIEDYRFSIPVMESFRNKKDRWPQTSKADMKKVLQRIRAEGPLMSRDFESSHKSGNWWDWKPAKHALQRLFFQGDLMVSHREGFQRVYDVPENILPPHINTSAPTNSEYYHYLITTTLRAQGIATSKEISHLRRIDAKVFKKALDELEEDGRVTPVIIEQNKVYYALTELLDNKLHIKAKIHLLSPFDNLVIWRSRIKNIFDFDYALECYLPESRRQYGYFCLPVLYKDEFIGRIDLKADRQNKILQVNKEHWADLSSRSLDPQLYQQVLQSFATFNQCDRIQMGRKLMEFET